MASDGTLTGGRPKMPPEVKRTNQLHVLMNDGEYDALCRDAIRARSTINAYVRGVLERARQPEVSHNTETTQPFPASTEGATLFRNR